MPFVGGIFGGGPVTDPFFADVLYLLNGDGAVTKDSGPSNRTLTTNATPTLDSADQLFGLPTYKIDIGSGDRVQIASDAFIPTAFGANEWCDEIWVKFDGFGSGLDYFTNSTTTLSAYTDGRAGGSVAIATTSYNITSAAGVLTTGVWTHIAFVRDHSTGSQAVLKLYVAGINVATSVNFSQASTVDTGAGLGWLLGGGTINPYGHFTQHRVTALHARYYADFTPPTAAFPTS